MKKLAIFLLLLLGCLAYAKQPAQSFHFFAGSYPFLPTNAHQHRSIQKINTQPGSFAVINGFRYTHEACSDQAILQRKQLINKINMPVMLSMADFDWVNCRNKRGYSISYEHLMRIREIFFQGKASLGAKPHNIYRESNTPRFSGFPENTYWMHQGILFATVHLPADNNLYQADAGRINEFEDRMIANKFWLSKITRVAVQGKAKAIVVFSDGNPFVVNTSSRDGFEETRHMISTMQTQYTNPILWVVGKPATSSEIRWSGNLGIARIGYGWSRIDVKTSDTPTFSIKQPIL